MALLQYRTAVPILELQVALQEVTPQFPLMIFISVNEHLHHIHVTTFELPSLNKHLQVHFERNEIDQVSIDQTLSILQRYWQLDDLLALILAGLAEPGLDLYWYQWLDHAEK